MILTLFSNNVGFLKGFHEYAVFVMLGFLGMGLIAYAFHYKRLIFTFFGCCAVLCIFLKSASNTNLSLPKENNQTKVAVAHVNVSSAMDSYQSFINELLKKNLDIISIQEVNPDWSRYLKEKLEETFPYHVENVRIDPFGMAIYSRLPILDSDTLIYDNIPFLTAKIELLTGIEITVLNTMIMPSINNSMDIIQSNQMKFVEDFLKINSGTELVLGDFNMVYWSNRIRDFRNNANLLNSRRDISQSVLSVPYDHIFYSPDLECTLFRDLIDTSGNRLGIYGNFQYSTGTDGEL